MSGQGGHFRFLGWRVTGLRLPFLIVAIILFVLAAIPPVPYSGSLLALGLAFATAAQVMA